MATPEHVLLVNASPDESDMYAYWLEGCGYRVSVAPSVAAARRIARTNAVDVLVIDAFFGAGSPRAEAVRRWSKLAHRDGLPIIILSGYLSDARRHLHGSAVIFKPCLPQQLSGCIERLLSASSRPSAVSDTGKPVTDCSPS